MSHGAVSRSVSGSADAGTVARMRAWLRDWLGTVVELDAQRNCDIVLAVSEALSNCAEHAYRGRAVTGTMALTTSYDSARSVVEVVVSDDGRWIVPNDATARGNFRGRGLPLLRALADRCAVDGGHGGTTVRLQFHNCPSREHRASAEVGGDLRPFDGSGIAGRG